MSKKHRFDSIDDAFALIDAIIDGTEDIEVLENPEKIESKSFDDTLNDMIYNRKKNTQKTSDVKVNVKVKEPIEEVEDTDEYDESEDIENQIDFSDESYNDDTLEEYEDDEIEEVLLSFINFSVHPELNRLVVDDNVSPTSYSFTYGLNRDLSKAALVGVYDADDVTDKYDLLMNYIITLKHPSAIYTKEEFINYIPMVTSYNSDKFKFYMTDEYVFAYCISTDGLADFSSVFDDNKYTPEQILQTMVSLSYACGDFDNAFYAEDTDYVEAFYNNEYYNFKSNFSIIFTEDDDTELQDSNPNVEPFDVSVYEVQEIQTIARATISSLIGESFFGDDDDDEEDLLDELLDELDDDEEDDDDLDDENEDESEDTAKDESEDVDLLGDDMEAVEEEHIIVDVHRKTDK